MAFTRLDFLVEPGEGSGKRSVRPNECRRHFVGSVLGERLPPLECPTPSSTPTEEAELEEGL
jgi:hypothetical protein